MDNYVKMDVCFCTRTIWFQLAVVAVVPYFVYQMIVFIRRRCFPQSPSAIKRRKKAAAKKKKAQTQSNAGAPVAYNPRSFLEDYNHSRVGSPRVFTFQSLVDATQNFQLERRMYTDGLGAVYKGEMVHCFRTNEVFAIRRLTLSHQSRKDFVQDVWLLNKAYHPNLAQLIGFSDDMDRTLVYKYVPGGTLENHLYGNQMCLDWNLRMKIALGVARALEYLQNIMKPSIYHYFISPSNVWLDKNYTPKLSAFGIIMTGKKVFFREDGVPQKLTDWVQPYLKDKENSSKMVDPMLDGNFDHEEFYECCSIVERCIDKEPNRRPLIADLVARMNRLITRVVLQGRQNSHLGITY